MLRAAMPGENLTFLDLAEAHILQVVRKGYGIPMKHYRATVEYLHSLGSDIHFLAHKDFVYDKRHFYLKDNDKLLSLSERGQYVDNAIIDRGLKQLMYGEDGYADTFYPKINGREQTSIIITPKIGFGQPTIARLGVNVDVIAARFDAGEHMKDLAADYGATPDEIEEALRSTRELVRVR